MVAVEGIDGAGKTLLCAALAERLRGHGLRVHLLDRRTLATEADFAGRRMAELRGVIWPAEAEPSDDALGTHVYLYLLAAWFVGLSRLTRGIVARHDIVLTDGSFYRVVAKAHARAGLDRDWLFGLFAHALRPDRVLLLDLDRRWPGSGVATSRRPRSGAGMGKTATPEAASLPIRALSVPRCSISPRARGGAYWRRTRRPPRTRWPAPPPSAT